MKQFKRTLALLLALVLSLGMAIPAFAANTATIAAQPASSIAGGTASMDVTIADNPGFAMLKVEVTYDTSKMTFTDAKSSFGMTFNTYTLSSGKVNLLWDKSNGDATGDGTIATLNFAVKGGASGTADVSLKFVEANNWELKSLQMATEKNAVTIGAGAGTGTITPVTTPHAITPAAATGGTVKSNASTAKSGERVTVTVTPESGKKLSALTVKTSSGKTVDVTKVSDTVYQFTMPDAAVTISASFAQDSAAGTGSGSGSGSSASSLPYRDVSSSNWFYDSVAYVTAKGLMNGTKTDQFSPNTDTTRAMVITILARLDKADVDGGKPWYQKAVDWGMANGVTDGTNPTATITREQLVTMLYRFAQLKKLDVSGTASIDSYPDAGNVHAYAVDAMRWAVGSGIINGISGKLEPRGNSTRAQIATMLMRYCEKYGV